MCRREIPQSFLEHPALLSSLETTDEQVSRNVTEDAELPAPVETEDFKWFYQGRNGWWEYDERTAQELEHHYKKGDKNCELLIAGFLYSIDFENMWQCRRNEPHRRRQIKRDLVGNVTDKKGIAGIRITSGVAVSVSGGNTSAVDALADQVSNIQIDQSRPTLRNLVDLGAASGANIALNDDDEDDQEEENDSTNIHNNDNVI